MGKRTAKLPSGRDVKRTGTGGVPLGIKVYKGDPKVDPKKPGTDLDYFRMEVATDESTVPYDAVKQALVDLYGEKPRVIKGVFFYTPDPWSEANVQWVDGKNGGVAVRRCDGQTMSRRLVDGKFQFDPHPCMCQNESKPSCKQEGRLIFWLPELCQRVGSLFLCMLVTHGENDIGAISDTVDGMVNSFGADVLKVSFELSRKPKPTIGGGMQTIKQMVYLYTGDKAAQLSAQNALTQSTSLALPSGQTSNAPFEIEVTHFYMKWLDNGVIEYRFKGTDGQGYATTDTEVVRKVMPNITSNDPVTVPTVVPYSIWASVSGNAITELLRGS